MIRCRFLVSMAVIALFCLPQAAKAVSLSGSDWDVTLSGLLTVSVTQGTLTSTLAKNNPIDNAEMSNTNVTQTSAGNISIPISITDPITLSVTATGTLGTTAPYAISASGYLADTGDLVVPAGTGMDFLAGSTVRAMNIHVTNLNGSVTGINDADTSGPYGPRGYYITGENNTGVLTADLYIASVDDDGHLLIDPDTGGYIYNGGVGIPFSEVTPFSAVLNFTTWSAQRPETAATVPEPGTIVMLLGFMATVIGYRCWKRTRA